MSLRRCRRCDGLNPETVRQCVHCGASSRNGRALFLAASAAASTLIACACYGLPPCGSVAATLSGGSCDNGSGGFFEEPAPDHDGGESDAGLDGGIQGDAGVDGGDLDAGIDGGP